MGDVLHALPAVAALRRAHPDWFLGWAIEPGWSELLEAKGASARGVERPIVDRWYPVPTRQWKKRPFSGVTLKEIAAVRRELRGERFDLCVDLQGAIRSAVVGKMAGAGKFVGPADPREGPAKWLYGRVVRTPAAHVIEQGCELLGGAVGETLVPGEVPLPVDREAESWCDALLSRVLRGRERFVVIAASAGWGAKQWPPERYGAVAAELGRAGYAVVVNAVRESDVLANAVVEASEGAASVAACSIAQLIALERRASLVIGGDTGPLHLAAALSRPVVGIYGPTDPARNGPYGTVARVLRHASSRRDHSRRDAAEAGLLEITADEVTSSALALLREER